MSNKLSAVLLLVLLFLVVSAPPSHALWWMVFHKPEYKGKIVDIDTKEPIEGAVVVAIYNKSTMGLGAGTFSYIINVQETLTDKDGMFSISSYTTLIQPFSWERSTTFIIFKPGYLSISGLNLEECLSGGTCKEAELPWLYNQQIKYGVAPGVVELPRLKTREERLKSIPSLPSVIDFLEKQKHLIRLINEEENSLGLEKSDPYKAREFILKMGR